MTFASLWLLINPLFVIQLGQKIVSSTTYQTTIQYFGTNVENTKFKNRLYVRK